MTLGDGSSSRGGGGGSTGSSSNPPVEPELSALLMPVCVAVILALTNHGDDLVAFEAVDVTMPALAARFGIAVPAARVARVMATSAEMMLNFMLKFGLRSLRGVVFLL
jgi:hypothetical protein